MLSYGSYGPRLSLCQQIVSRKQINFLVSVVILSVRCDWSTQPEERLVNDGHRRVCHARFLGPGCSDAFSGLQHLKRGTKSDPKGTLLYGHKRRPKNLSQGLWLYNGKCGDSGRRDRYAGRQGCSVRARWQGVQGHLDQGLPSTWSRSGQYHQGMSKGDPRTCSLEAVFIQHETSLLQVMVNS